MTEGRNTAKWLDDLYTGKGRDFRSGPPLEENSDLPFFDSRFRKLARRWYRTRFNAGDTNNNQPEAREAKRVRL